MKSKIVLPAFLIMVLVQLYVPAKMIFKKESVVTTGKEFRFKTAPVDPTDPFRGKYIVLSFEENAIQVTNANDWNQGDHVFVSLATNDKGYARILSVSKDEPLNEEDYVKANLGFIMNDSLSNVTIQYPFDRFYMEESKAYDAEQAYNESTRDTSRVTYAIVKVRNGDAVVTDVIINGVPIREAVKNWRENQLFDE